MVILDGKKLADKILEDSRKEVEKLSPIKLVVVLVGDDPDSLKFIKQKQKAAEKIGIEFKLYKFNLKISNQNLTKEVNKITKDKSVTGIVIQLPLPKHINTQKILSLIPVKKDPDALSVDNFLAEPPTASGIIRILKEYNIEVKGKKIVIVGKGRLVGGPLAAIMERFDTNLTVCNIQTKNLHKETLKADILVSATGQFHLIKESMVKQKAIVIDAGINDIDFENIKRKASYITPPTGGIGPMTVAILIDNLIKLAKKT